MAEDLGVLALAAAAARAYREPGRGGSWAVIDTLYLCGHRGQG